MNRKVDAMNRFTAVTEVKSLSGISLGLSLANLSQGLAFATISRDSRGGPRRPNAARALWKES